MAVSKVKEFKVRFGASSLCLQAIADGEARMRRSAECKTAILTLLEGVPLKTSEKREITTLIVENPRNQFWNPADLSALLSAVEKVEGPARRKSQDFTPNVLEFFVASEWEGWKTQGLPCAESICSELIQRIKSIGGKNLCECSKKLAVAIWLFLRGDGRSLGVNGRNLASVQFKSRLARSMRDFEPATYLEKLPRLEEYRAQHSDMFVRAFPMEEPQLLDATDVREVMYLDSLLKCRGLGYAGQHDTAAQQSQHVSARQPPQLEICGGPMTPAVITQLALEQLASVMNASRQEPSLLPGLRVHGTQPLGRPMRSVANLNSLTNAAAAAAPSVTTLVAAPPAATVVAEPQESMAAHGDADPRDDVDAVMARMLERKGAHDDEVVESDSDQGVPQAEQSPPLAKTSKKPMKKTKNNTSAHVTTPRKPSVRMAPKKSAHVATPTTRTSAAPPKKSACADTPTKDKLAAWPRRPRIGWERSRDQVMCRSGKSGAGSTNKNHVSRGWRGEKSVAAGRKVARGGHEGVQRLH